MGYELDGPEQIDFFARLAYLNPTASWVSFNNAGSASVSAALSSDRAVEEIFREDGAHAVFCAVSAPTGRATKCDGGYRVTGRWSFASGAAGAKYANLAALADDPAGPLLLNVPMTDVTMIDNWHVAAVQGSGSIDLEMEDVFVPEYMAANPLAPAKRGKGNFQKLGYKVFVAPENAGFSLGCAQRMRDEIVALTRTKKRLLDPQTVGSRGSFQLVVARADQMIRAAKAHLAEEMRRVEAIAAADGPEPVGGRGPYPRRRCHGLGDRTPGTSRSHVISVRGRQFTRVVEPDSTRLPRPDWVGTTLRRRKRKDSRPGARPLSMESHANELRRSCSGKLRSQVRSDQGGCRAACGSRPQGRLGPGSRAAGGRQPRPGPSLLWIQRSAPARDHERAGGRAPPEDGNAFAG